MFQSQRAFKRQNEMILIAVNSQPGAAAVFFFSFLTFFSISADWRETGNDSERKPNFRSRYNINKNTVSKKFPRHIFSVSFSTLAVSLVYAHGS